MKKNIQTLAVLLAFGILAVSAQAQGHYKSFIVSTYATQGTVQRLIDGDLDPAESWSNLTRNLKIDKIYIEVMRNHTLVDEAGLEKLKKFYQDQGVQVCGGLAYSVSEANGYQGFDYADPENRAFAKKAVEMAARHMDNLKPGVNKGGWVDQGGANPIDRYSEQLLDTVFSRCPEMCCFNYSGMLGAIRFGANRTWADQPTSLNLAEAQKTIGPDEDLTFADIAAYTLGQADKVLAHVGKPVGIKTYTPYHATGEEFLHDYLGMIGLPMDIFPQFPTDADMVLLTEQAKFDLNIVEKIKAQLRAGKSVCVTSGFLRAMKGKGVEDICEIEATGATVPVRRFTFAGGPGAPFRSGRGFGRGAGASQTNAPLAADSFEASRDIFIPEIKYFNILTHDAWGDTLGISPGGTTYPVLLSGDYSKGKFYVLNIPNDPADLYAFPSTVLSVIRAALGSAEPIRIDNAPAQVALFRYDNSTFIVQNYLPAEATVTVSIAGNAAQIQDLLTGKEILPAPATGRGFGGFGGGFRGRGPAAPPRTAFTFTVPPHSYMAFTVK